MGKNRHVRAEQLAALGFKTYREYLNSPHWADLKKRFYTSRFVRRAKYGMPRCFACCRFGIPMEVHHRTYKRLGKERLQDLALMCGDCHEAAHRAHAEKPYDGLWKATKRLIKRAQPKDGWPSEPESKVYQ